MKKRKMSFFSLEASELARVLVGVLVGGPNSVAPATLL